MNSITRRLPLWGPLICMVLLFAPYAHGTQHNDFLLFYSNDVHGETAPCG